MIKCESTIQEFYGKQDKQSKANVENFETCKNIARTLEAYAEGKFYRCSQCGEVFNAYESFGAGYTIDENEEEHLYCSNCGADNENENISDFEQLGLLDYFEDMLDVKYIYNCFKELENVRVLVAFGGPNIWIDTETKKVELYWWNERASYSLDGFTCDEIVDLFKDLTNC